MISTRLLQRFWLLLLLLAAGCVVSPAQRAQYVRECFPDAEITTIPGQFEFFVIRTPSGEVWTAQPSTATGTTNATAFVMAFPAEPK